MIVEHATHPQFLSNTYLVADGAGGPAFFVDAGGPVEGLIATADRLGLEPTHVLLTHHHFDHVSEVPALRERWPELEVLIHPLELELLPDGIAADPRCRPARRSRSAPWRCGRCTRPGTPRGCCPCLSASARRPPAPVARGPMPAAATGVPRRAPRRAVSPAARRSCSPATRSSRARSAACARPAHTTYADLRDSIMGTLMELPPNTVIHPGHADPTTVAREWEQNGFIRIWRGLDPEGSERCEALGEPATLILLGEDYDGGKKAWVRWEDGKDDIVPGSQVQPAG